jgi:hypothetical protein
MLPSKPSVYVRILYAMLNGHNGEKAASNAVNILSNKCNMLK